jgi:hypothetical protein
VLSELELANERLERRRAEWATGKNPAAPAPVYRAALPLTDCLESLLADCRQVRRVARLDARDAYVAAWLNINEASVRDATLDVKYYNGYLHITVSNPALKTELASFLAAPLLANLRQELPRVNLRGLKFRCGAAPSAEERVSHARRPRRPT